MNRAAIKLEMIRDRITMNGCKCDLCGNFFRAENMAMHEIIERYRTIGNKKARELSFQKELCSLLCHECHTIASQHEEILWTRNYNRYGQERVEALVEEFKALYPIKIGLPE